MPLVFLADLVAPRWGRTVDLFAVSPDAGVDRGRDVVEHGRCVVRPVVSDITFKSAPANLQASGLLGWVQLSLDGRIGLDGVAVRKTASGKLTLSFHERLDAHGRAHAIVRPLDAATRLAIEAQVFDALALDGRLIA